MKIEFDTKQRRVDLRGVPRLVIVGLQMASVAVCLMAAWYARHTEKIGLDAIQGAERRVAEMESRIKLQQAVLLSMFDSADLRIDISRLLYARANDRLSSDEISEISVLVAEAYLRNPRLRPSLLISMIEQESSYRPGCISSKGAVGLMQVMPTTARPYLRTMGHPEDPDVLFDPVVNTKVGIAYFEDLITQYNGNEVAAVNAYFWGPRNVNKMLSYNQAQLSSLKYGYDVLRRAETLDIL